MSYFYGFGQALSQGFVNSFLENQAKLSGAFADLIEGFNTEISSKYSLTDVESFFKRMAPEMGKIAQNASIAFSQNFDFEEIAKNFPKEKLAKLIQEISRPITDSLALVLSGSLKTVIWQTTPPIILALTALTGSALTITYLYQKAVYNLSRPSLAQVERNVHLLTPVIDFASSLIFSKCDYPKPHNAPEVEKQIEGIIENIKQITHHEGDMENLLLFGPSGTGKTLIAQTIMRQVGISYIEMSGADLAQHIQRGEHVSQLNRLLDRAESKPTILFIDEAEALVLDREKIQRPQQLELMDALLKRTGGANKNLMLILTTNRREDVDPAILSRMDHEIKIDLPQKEARSKILEEMIQKRCTTEQQTFFSDSGLIEAIARQTTGFSCRDISQMMNIIFNRISIYGSSWLTRENVLSAATQYRQQKNIADTRSCFAWAFGR